MKVFQELEVPFLHPRPGGRARGAASPCASPCSRESMLDALPGDCILRILDCVSLADLARACASLRAVCHAWEAAMLPLLETVSLQRLRPSGTQAPSSARRSSRCALAPAGLFASAVRALKMRTEAMHHAIACLGQDSKDLTATRVRKLWARWQPCLVDRASPVYDVCMLMEIIRARVHESAIAAAAAELLRLGASVNATNSEGLSPLIMASARGLPKVVKLLLAHGAWLGQRGLGRFRLADTRQSIRGRMSAQEFVSALLEAEARIGVCSKQQRSLDECRRLLSEASVVGAIAGCSDL